MLASDAAKIKKDFSRVSQLVRLRACPGAAIHSAPLIYA
jgi:hypothetical protein